MSDYAPTLGFAARSGGEARGRKELEDGTPWPIVDSRRREGANRSGGALLPTTAFVETEH